ncbi:Riboflavin transporter FmnP [Clostridium cavendishii DSM 21758]|uniref:Riboflavin transporter n=1 Tax=Clostridium cavendishii DSM 21758 TaxID=1121302 RepID=A0A1M6UF99_9CLOT|nr:ECF transporter S component [Clostridium cavendishii]SHK67831.1 Riboflavin transporter FmnP [Clostridium cavendishii DSM 21758]
MKNVNERLNKQIKIALLGAIAVVLMYFDFPIPGFPPFLKIDLSDIPALIGGFILGPVAGVVIELIKNLIYALIKGSGSAMIGELANFSVGAVWVFTSASIYKRGKDRKQTILSLIIGFVVMAVFASLLNYFVLLPMYAKMFKMNFGNVAVFVSTVILPFNLIKGSVVSVATLALYKGILPVIKKESLKENNKKALL